MPEDTAVLEPVTAEPVAETPPPDGVTETVEAQPTETGAPEPTETRLSLDDLLKDVADDDLLGHAKVKDILARQRESARQSEEARQSRQFRQQAANMAPQAAAYIAHEAKQAAEMGRDVNVQAIQNAFAWLRQGEAELQYRAHKTALMEFAPPAVAEEFEALENRYVAGKIDENEFWRQAYEKGYKARLEKDMPRLHKEWEAEQKKKNAANSEAQRVITSDHAAREEARPTSGGGMPAASTNLDAVMANGTLSEKNAAFRAKYGFDL